MSGSALGSGSGSGSAPSHRTRRYATQSQREDYAALVSQLHNIASSKYSECQLAPRHPQCSTCLHALVCTLSTHARAMHVQHANTHAVLLAADFSLRKQSSETKF